MYNQAHGLSYHVNQVITMDISQAEFLGIKPISKPDSKRNNRLAKILSLNNELTTEALRARHDVSHASMIATNYNLSVNQYNAMLDRQAGCCAICRRKCKSNKRLAVDHDHDTGQVRGLLCAGCNTMLGHMDDSKEWLQAAIDYLG